MLTASNLGPYHQARYEFLAQGPLELVIVKTPVAEYFRPWTKDATQEGFRAISPFGANPTKLFSMRRVLRAARRLLRHERPDVVVCVGYNTRYIWATSLLCRIFKIPCVLYLVGWEGERARNPRKEMAKRLYCRQAFGAAMATGVHARDYARTLGISAQRIWRIGNVVDNDYFAQVRESSPRLAQLPPAFFLSVARLSPEKNLTGLIDAFNRYRQNGGTWDLCIAGTGPQEEELKAQTSATLGALADHVHWLGWVGYKELPELYHRASCLVIPSFVEPWGLVVNEAMAAGLPVLVSDQCGCQPELCKPSENGFGFDPDNMVQLAQLMNTMSDLSPESFSAMGESSRRVLTHFTLETWRQAFVNCVVSVAGGLGNEQGEIE